jgi:hypothetical protein
VGDEDTFEEDVPKVTIVSVSKARSALERPAFCTSHTTRCRAKGGAEDAPNASRWFARGAFFVTTLALLGTSRPPRWTVEGTITGPRGAPETPADQALVLAIESSGEPLIRASGALPPNPYNEGGFPCTSRTRCVLPPGTKLDSLTLEGSCGGCSTKCAPPPNSFVRATTSLAPMSTDTAVAKKDATLPSHDTHWIATRVLVTVEGADLIVVDLHTESKDKQVLSDQRLPCRKEYGKTQSACPFILSDDLFKTGKQDVSIVATATGYGTCATAPCAAPHTLRILSLELDK